MARVKKRKTKRKKSKSALNWTGSFGSGLRFILRCFPFVFFLSLFVGGFFGVREILYADANLKIQTIQITPVGALDHSQYDFLEKKWLGENILQVDLKSITETLQKNPRIQNAKVYREMPSGIRIDIQVREPMALIQFSPKENYGVVAKDGVILSFVDGVDTAYPMIKAHYLGVSNPYVGMQLKHRDFSEAVRFLTSYAQTPLAATESIQSLIFDKLGNATMALKDGLEIRLGRRPSLRIDTMKKIIPLLEGEARAKINYIDLQYDNVIVKKK